MPNAPKRPKARSGAGHPRSKSPSASPTVGRRALSHVGGDVEFVGDHALRSAVVHALTVRSDEVQTRRHVHGFHSYPARLHPDTARGLVAALSETGGTVMDPFCGSGTVLVEALALGRNVIGVDANPLSIALCECKLRPGESSQRGKWIKAAHAIGKAADADRRSKLAVSPQVVAEDKHLFSPSVLAELDYLRTHIAEVKDPQVQAVLWLVLSSILSKVSDRIGDSGQRLERRSLSSGYVIRFFRDRAGELAGQLAEFVRMLPSPSPAVSLSVGDARQLSMVSEGSVDLVVTSPPYPGVYDYLEHHEPRLRWLGLDWKGFEVAEIGAKRRFTQLTGDAVSERWANELGEVLGAVSRTLKPSASACFVLADTAVSGQVLRGDVVVEALAPAAGLQLRAVASQKRPHFHHQTAAAFRSKPRREHLVVLTKPTSIEDVKE